MGAFLSSQSSKTKFFYPKTPASVSVRGANSSSETKSSLKDLIQSRCPSLFDDFRPAWWLFNGHLQTIYCVTGDFTGNDVVVYDRTYLGLVDGGTLGLDFTPPNRESLPDSTPIVVVLHGLTGGSYESYVRSILAPACTPVDKGGLGYRGVVVNFRGCAGVPITSPQLYSAGHTDDIRQALAYISKVYPDAPLLGLGFSLGANVLVRYLSEEKENSRISAGCILGCPWDLNANNDALERTLVGRHIYAKGMGSNLIRLLKRHISSLTKDPTHKVAHALAAALSLKSPTLGQFDQAFTRVAGGSPPTFPFATSKDYYTWASSHYVLPDVRTPLLALNSADDPVVQNVPVEAGVENPWTVIALTPGGGHLGWFEQGESGKMVVQRWVKKPVLEWLRMAAEDLVTIKRGKEVYESNDGFLKEVGRDDIGCKEIEGGGLIKAAKDNEMIQGL